MHYHVINEAIDTPQEIGVREDNRTMAENLFEDYMITAAICQLKIKCESRWSWKVQNPITKEWSKVAIEECNEAHDSL